MAPLLMYNADRRRLWRPVHLGARSLASDAGFSLISIADAVCVTWGVMVRVSTAPLCTLVATQAVVRMGFLVVPPHTSIAGVKAS